MFLQGVIYLLMRVSRSPSFKPFRAKYRQVSEYVVDEKDCCISHVVYANKNMQIIKKV